MLTVLIVWVCVSLPVAVFVAALGKSGIREEEARDRGRTSARSDAAAVARPTREDAETHGSVP